MLILYFQYLFEILDCVIDLVLYNSEVFNQASFRVVSMRMINEIHCHQFRLSKVIFQTALCLLEDCLVQNICLVFFINCGNDCLVQRPHFNKNKVSSSVPGL